MKYLFRILFLLLMCKYANAQTLPSVLPNPNSPTGFYNIAWIKAGNGLILPLIDTTYLPKYTGTMVIRPQDHKVYYYDSTTLHWNQFSVGAQIDTTSLINRINLKLNISDTTAMLSPYLRKVDTTNKWVQNVYARNDSLFKQKNSTETFIHTFPTTGSGTVTSVGLSMPSAFTVTNSPVTGAGTLTVSGAGTSLQYIRGNGTLATFDTTAIPNFYSKVQSLFSGTSPITYSAGVIGINNATATGTKGAATFTSGDFSDNGSGTISLADITTTGACLNCQLSIDSKGRITSYADGADFSIFNTSGAGDTLLLNSDSIKRLNTGFGLNSIATAASVTHYVDTNEIATQYDLTQIQANNGLSKSGDTIQLGGPFTKNTTWTSTTPSYRLTFNGNNTFVEGALLDVITTGNIGYAIRGETTNGRGLLGVATTGVGIYGTATGSGGNGVFANSLAGSAIVAQSTDGLAIEAITQPAATNTVVPVISLSRPSTTVGANGIGGSIDMYARTTTNDQQAAQIIWKYTDATNATYTSALEFWNANNATVARKALLAGSGQWTWDGYTSITQKTDTSAIKPIGYNTSTGLVEPMANWVGNVPPWDNVMAVGNTTTNKIGFMDANNGMQLTFRLRNLDTTNDQSIAALDATARRGKAVVRLISTQHKESELQLDRYTHPDSTSYVIIDTLKAYTVGTVSDVDVQRDLRKGFQITDVIHSIDIMNVDTVGRIGLQNVHSPTAWLHLPSQAGSIYPLKIMPNTTPTNANSGAIYNTRYLLKFIDDNGIEWNMNNELGTAANGSYTAPTYTFASNSAFGMSYSSVAGSLVLSGSGTSNGAIAISNSNSSGQTGWDLRDHNFSQRAICWLNNANSRLRLAAGTGISLDFEAGGFNDNNPSVRITSSGNMLIGTTTETGGYKLKNNGGFYQDGAFRLQPIIDPPGSYKILVRSLTSDSTVYGVASSTFSTPTSTATQIHDSLTANNISYGTYTPTLTNSSNIDASTAYQCQWMRVGNVVTVSGKIDIDPTSATTLTILGISLPITSAIGNDFEAGGTAAAAIPNNSGAIKADATNDRAQLDFTSGTDVANRSWFFSFTYLITPA